MAYRTKYEIANYIHNYYKEHNKEDVLGHLRLHVIMYILFTEYLYVFNVQEEEGIIEAPGFFPKHLFDANYQVCSHGVTDPDFRYYEFQESTIEFPTTFDRQIQTIINHLIDQTLNIDDFSLVDYVLECPCRQYMTNGEPLDITLLENHYHCNSRVFHLNKIRYRILLNERRLRVFRFYQ